MDPVTHSEIIGISAKSIDKITHRLEQNYNYKTDYNEGPNLKLSLKTNRDIAAFAYNRWIITFQAKSSYKTLYKTSRL